MTPTPSKSGTIKTLYFYAVSLISLMMIVFSTADLVNIGLKTWIFKKADQNAYPMPPCELQMISQPGIAQEERDRQIKQCEASRVSESEVNAIQKQRDAVRDLAFLVVGIPVFAYHWATIRKEQREEKSNKG